jgi:autotransporter translocation and assembly factor TamB
MKRFLFSVLALIAAMLVLAAAFLFLPPAFRLGLRAANRYLPVSVQIAQYHHTPGSLRVSGVRVTTPRGALCEMAALTVEYRPLAILFGRIEVATLELENPHVKLQRFENGEFNLFESSHEQGIQREEEEEAGSWINVVAPLRIREIRIADGSVCFEDQASGLSLVWDPLDVEGAFSGQPLQGELRLSKGRLRVAGSTLPALQMRTECHASLSDGKLKVSGFRLAMEASSVSGSGGYSLTDKRFALRAELEALPLGQVLAILGVKGVQVEGLSGTLEAETTGGNDGVFRAELKGTAYGQQVRARLAGSLLEEQILIESLDASNPEATLTGHGSWDIASGELRGNLGLAAPLLAESFLPYGIEDLEARGLRADGALLGTLQDPEIRLRLDLDELYHKRPLVKGFSAEGGIEPGQGIHLKGRAVAVPLLGETGGASEISAKLHQGVAAFEIRAEPSLSLQGRLNVENRNVELAVQARQLALSFLAEDRVHSHSTLSLTGEGSFQGNLDRRETWNGEGKVDALRLSIPDLVIKTARPASVHIAQGLLQAEAALEANGSDLAVRGSCSLESEGELSLDVNGSLALEDFYLPARYFLPALEGWQGNLQIRGSVLGPLDAPRLKAVAELSNGSAHLALPEGRDQNESTKGGSDGQDAVEEDLPTKEILAEKVQATLKLDGPVAAPSGTLNVTLKESVLYGEPLGPVHLEAESRDGRTWSQRLEIRRGNDRLSVQGEWEIPTGKVSGTIRSSELELATLVKSEKMTVQGITGLQGTIEGTVNSPRVTLRATTKSLAIQDAQVGDVDTDLEYEQDRVSVRVGTDAGRFEISVNLDKDREFSFQGTLQDVPVGPILEKVNLRGWTGKASLSGSLTGPLTDLEGWEGEISLEEVDLQAVAVPLRLEEPVVLRFERGVLTIPDAVVSVEGSPLRLQGTVGRENHFTLQGTLSLGPFASLIPWVRFDTARAEADLVVGGSLSSPLVDGTLHLEAGQVKLEGLAYPVDSVRADLRAESNRFTLLSLTAQVAEGEVRASGAMTVAPLSFDDVNLVLESVPVRLSDSLVGRLRGELLFQGTRDSSVLSGKLRILEARYGEDFDIVGVILRPSRPKQKRVRAADPFLSNMRLDLNIKSGPDLVVRNNVARAVLSTDMNIRGTAATPVPLGTVKVEEGRVVFSKKRFDITQGSLSFIDPRGGNPNLQLESVTKIQGTTREYSIYLTFTGPLDRIQLELRSVPDLEREDIVFMLVTGKTRDEYYASSSDSTDTEETAQRLALSGIGFLIGGDVKALAGLDTFELERTEGEEFGVRTTVGKQFNERVEVRGVFALGSGQQVSEAQIGYLLTDTLYVVGTQRTDGSFGLDFRVRLSSR